MNNKRWDTLWVNCSLATMQKSAKPYGLLHDAAMAVKDHKIAWIGKVTDLTDPLDHLTNQVINLEGRCVTPGLIDCHTHLIYAGNRSAEFVMRMQGKSYADIARAGGGIWNTVQATRAASEEELFQQSLPRLHALLAEGVTTVEIKSGYGLDLANEIKILRVAQRLAEYCPIQIKKTFLGAHAVPPEFQGKADQYIDLICEEMLPVMAKENLLDFVDVFCESIAFNLKQTERVFSTAKKLGLGIKCHANQLSDLGAASLAAQYNALSVDHLEFLGEEGVQAIAKSKTVAVLLPGAFYFLREKQLPPIALFRQYQVPMAIATDCNPGTSPVSSLLLMLNMACVLFGLTPEEALLGVTAHAAKALGIDANYGTLEVGKAADFAIWNIHHPDELSASIGFNSLYKRQISLLHREAGEKVARRDG